MCCHGSSTACACTCAFATYCVVGAFHLLNPEEVEAVLELEGKGGGDTGQRGKKEEEEEGVGEGKGSSGL